MQIKGKKNKRKKKLDQNESLLCIQDVMLLLFLPLDNNIQLLERNLWVEFCPWSDEWHNYEINAAYCEGRAVHSFRQGSDSFLLITFIAKLL